MRFVVVIILLLFIFQSCNRFKRCFECDALMSKHKYEEALTCYNDGDSSTCKLYGKADALFYLKKYEEAKKILVFITNNSAKFSAENTGNSYIFLSRVYSVQDSVEKEMACLVLAEKYVQTSNLFCSMSYCYCKLKMYNEAIVYGTRSLNIDPLNAYSYNNRALAYIMTNDFERAKADLEKSMQYDPRNPYAFKHRGLLFLKQENNESACTDFNTAIELGYREFGDEADKFEVDSLIKQNCGNVDEGLKE